MPRPKCLENDIGGSCQTPKEVAAISGFEVERDAALRRVVVPERQAPLRVRAIVEEGADMAAWLAAWRLDLDDIGTQITQQFTAELACLVGQFQNPNLGQRTRRRRDLRHVSISSW